jgi:dipeptide transport system ATP-binding protein
VVPGLYDRPKGCLFNPRCRFATEHCRQAPPVPAAAALGYALCHYPLVAGVPQGHPLTGVAA